MTPRCGRPMQPYEAVWGALPDGIWCGRPEGHSPPCRSVQALAAARTREQALWPRRRVQRRGRRLRVRLAAVVELASAQARERAHAA